MYNNTKAVDLYGFVKTFRSLLIDKVLLIIIKFIKNKLLLNIKKNEYFKVISYMHDGINYQESDRCNQIN